MKLLMKPLSGTVVEYPQGGIVRELTTVAHKIHGGLFMDSFTASRANSYSSGGSIVYGGTASPATNTDYNSNTNTVPFIALFSAVDHSGKEWFRNPTATNIPSLVNNFNVVPPTFTETFPESDFLGWCGFGARYGKVPTYFQNVETVDGNKFATLGVTWPQADVVKLADGIAKYVYFIAYKSETENQFVTQLDVNDVLGTNTHSSNYEVILDTVDFSASGTRRIKSFNAKVRYQVTNA